MRWLFFALAATLCACAGPLSSLTQRSSVATETGRFDLDFSERDLPAEAIVRAAISRASPTLAQWGNLVEPVTVRILPSHELLEQAVGRDGYAWLRAWARYDEVFLQSPRTWSLFGARQAEVDELVLHELTHCLMYQSAATRTGWSRKQIPLWFREGMASVTARQEYRWPTLEHLARFASLHPGEDPLTASDELYRQRSEVVYSASHHAFAFLLRRYGHEAVKNVLLAMRAGAIFPEAFEQGVGISASAFTDDFRRYVRTRGFKPQKPKRAPTLVEQPVPAPPSAANP